MMSIKTFVARLRLNQFKGKVHSEAFDFPAVLFEPKHILVCLPSSLRQLTLVKQFLPALADLFKTAEITFLPMPGVKIADIFPHKGFTILSPTLDQLTWSGLPKKSFLRTLQSYNFDLLLDLNLEASLFTSCVLLAFPKAVRIGRGNHLGQPFYNLEIKTKYLRDERNIYRSLFEMLRLFKNRRTKRPVVEHKSEASEEACT
jgi:ADP-heptose:LPS heptosyltransferase